jgi:hypothetical protein
MDEESERMIKMILDPANDKEEEIKFEDNNDNNKENIPPPLPTCECKPEADEEARYPMPLIDHLCKRYHCSLKEVQVLLQGLDTRREIIHHLRTDLQLRTNHLRPANRNFVVRCGDMTAQAAGCVLALGGYMGVTVSKATKKKVTKKNFPTGPCLLLLPPQPPFAPSLFAMCDRIRGRTASVILSTRGADSGYKAPVMMTMKMRIHN